MTQSQPPSDIDLGHVDVSKSHALGVTPRQDRESHTVDLAYFTRKCEELRAWRNTSTGIPYHEEFWTYMHGLLAFCELQHILDEHATTFKEVSSAPFGNV